MRVLAYQGTFHFLQKTIVHYQRARERSQARGRRRYGDAASAFCPFGVQIGSFINRLSVTSNLNTLDNNTPWMYTQHLKGHFRGLIKCFNASQGTARDGVAWLVRGTTGTKNKFG